MRLFKQCHDAHIFGFCIFYMDVHKSQNGYIALYWIGICSQNSLDTKNSCTYKKKRAQERCKPAFFLNLLCAYVRRSSNSHRIVCHLIFMKKKTHSQTKMLNHVISANQNTFHIIESGFFCLSASVNVNGPSKKYQDCMKR